MVSDYERQRLLNMERNRALLIQLGLDKPFFEPKEIKRPKAKAGSKKRKSADDSESAPAAKSARTESKLIDASSSPDGVRRSSRNAGRTVDYKGEKVASSPLPISFKSGIRSTENGGKLGSEAGSKRLHDPFGSIPGVEVGTWWESREGCSADAIHAPWVAGISGGALEGAYSVALSGGYPEDVDLGYAFTYTGSGGRELKGTKANPKNLRTAAQSYDQDFSKTSSETGKPVRVIRGFKLDSPYAPYEGYRYDGLYKVEKAWQEKGMQGFLVCKFAFKRLPNQPALPRRADDAAETDATTETKPTEEEPASETEEIA
ncbi:PUA-like domain-containing protein [Mycena rosella]|uniref:PUA-like domain-containing protein n=1 Tax=Mycena rosella TaxID=1033263 RepID=A0AAD7M8R8_MYCRO|nr:PUA-like domain-containing protein [Mycena rosella]